MGWLWHISSSAFPPDLVRKWKSIILSTFWASDDHTRLTSHACRKFLGVVGPYNRYSGWFRRYKLSNASTFVLVRHLDRSINILVRILIFTTKILGIRIPPWGGGRRNSSFWALPLGDPFANRMIYNTCGLNPTTQDDVLCNHATTVSGKVC